MTDANPRGAALAGRVVVVFGAGSSGPGWGTGKAAAFAYARAGARVACVDLHRERAEETAQLIRSENGEALAHSAEVASSDEVGAAIRAAVEKWGRLDVLHN